MLLETALLRAPLIHIKSQRWNEAIARYRTVLRATESSGTQALRLTFARQLAELLLRKMCQVQLNLNSSKMDNKMTDVFNENNRPVIHQSALNLLSPIGNRNIT